MKRTFAIILITFCIPAFAQKKINVARQIDLSVKQYKKMLSDLKGPALYPHSTNPDGSIKTYKSDWWCSGFFGGSLWYLYEYTRDSSLKSAANKWTIGLQKEQFNTSTHDLGFMLYCSFGNGYRLTNSKVYKDVLLNGAHSLATRFNPKVGLIQSWNSFKGYKYPVIIDNMMNLEYLLWAAKTTKDKNYYNICVSHADKTMANHFRKDYSSYHVVCYDSVGNVLARKTAQGYSDESAWARGQAWGLYGYTVMYRETEDKKYLEQASHIADFFMHNPTLPVDKIPYWDFNSPTIPNDFRDASSAAVAASALLELCTYTEKTQSKAYFELAEKILESLSGPEYFSKNGNGHFLLKHSTGNKPINSDVDVPLIYADYYYLEALLRYDKLTEHFEKGK